jgi:hypothetical protein
MTPLVHYDIGDFAPAVLRSRGGRIPYMGDTGCEPNVWFYKGLKFEAETYVRTLRYMFGGQRRWPLFSVETELTRNPRYVTCLPCLVAAYRRITNYG